MGFLRWVMSFFYRVYLSFINFFYSYIFGNSETTQPTVNRFSSMPDFFVEEKQEDLKEYTITDDNEAAVYADIAQTLVTAQEPINIKLIFNKNNIISEFDQSIKPDPFVSNTNLLNMLKQHKNIKKLHLKSAGIGTNGLLVLSEFLTKNNKGLESLDLSYNNNVIKNRDEGLIALFNALSKDKDLRELNLDQTNIQGDIVDVIEKFLENNCSLVAINLCNNEINAPNAVKIGEAFHRNKKSSLEYISLSWDKIFTFLNMDVLLTEIESIRNIEEIQIKTNLERENNQKRCKEFLYFTMCTEAKSNNFDQKTNSKTNLSCLSDVVLGSIGEFLFNYSIIKDSNNTNEKIKIRVPKPIQIIYGKGEHLRGPPID